MPAGVSALALATTTTTTCSNSLKSSKSFTVLHERSRCCGDPFDSSLPVLNVFDEAASNGEVGSRRTSTTTGRNFPRYEREVYARNRALSRSNDYLLTTVNLPGKMRCCSDSRSHGNLLRIEDLGYEDFGRLLKDRLRKAKEREEEARRRQQQQEQQVVQHPKPFITTVKSGEFLMPPPEVAALLGIAPSCGQQNYLQENGTDEQDGLEGRLARFRHLVALNPRRPEVSHERHNSRCRALKATEDFGHLQRSGNASTMTTARKSRRDMHSTNFPTPRSLPKKLEPIESMAEVRPSPRDQVVPFGNLTFDRRNLGSTLPCDPSARPNNCEISEAAKLAEVRKRQINKKRCQLRSQRSLLQRINSPPPVPGRKHEPVQTDQYLEELFENPEVDDVGIQTDYFLDRPATPPQCPPKTGLDACTQVEPGELFDFDVEVQPILEVLVGKTIEQALTEVLEEEEIARLREQQRRFHELRAAEKAEAQRLQEEDRRIREEKEKRLKQQEEDARIQQETEDRVAAAVLLTGYVAELLPSVLDNLKVSGLLLDEIKSDVEDGFMPWLVEEVKKEVGSMIASRAILEGILREIIEKRAEAYARLGEEYDSRGPQETPEGVPEFSEEYIEYRMREDDESYEYEEHREERSYSYRREDLGSDDGSTGDNDHTNGEHQAEGPGVRQDEAVPGDDATGNARGTRGQRRDSEGDAIGNGGDAIFGADGRRARSAGGKGRKERFCVQVT